jgi:hypothetical protein
LTHVDEAKADVNEALQQGESEDVAAVGVSLGVEGMKEWVEK